MRDLIDHSPFEPLCSQNGFEPGMARTLIVGMLNGYVPQAKPRITHMLGIPGAGKTTFVRQMDPGAAVVIGFDAIMEKIPGYRADKAALGAEAAFAKWELCARAIGYEVLFRALESGLDVILDHGGARTDHVELLRYLRAKKGYTVHVVSLQVDPETAITRALARERHLPPQYILERKKVLDTLLPQYMAVADVFKEFDTSDKADADTGRQSAAV